MAPFTRTIWFSLGSLAAFAVMAMATWHPAPSPAPPPAYTIVQGCWWSGGATKCGPVAWPISTDHVGLMDEEANDGGAH
jgi:hypothetical protein